MELMTRFIAKVSNGISVMKIKGAPKAVLYLFSGVFLSFGCLYLIGVLLELYHTGKVNYVAINQFISIYFGPAVVGTFVIIGKALIDKDENGIPDEWEKEDKQ